MFTKQLDKGHIWLGAIAWTGSNLVKNETCYTHLEAEFIMYIVLGAQK
ncbi:hypothetical protein T12_7105 [Trichinella patagoniensis]|uniref:Uncharacterized protein n=1 Tax=Trichinella patagoniensis TaxID=990121 RepID=A0A0V0YQI6_9BILA|nr:hypothetical protein T12_7105 [Trichinella patagoniensis]